MPPFYGHDSQKDELSPHGRYQATDSSSHQNMAYGAREFLHQHNPFHGFWGRSNVSETLQAFAQNRESHRNGFTNKVARLTLEDMEVGIDAAQYEVHHGRKNSLQVSELYEDSEVLKASHSSNRLYLCLAVVAPRYRNPISGERRFVDGPDDSDFKHQHRDVHNHYDADHLSHHHHPDYLESPYTKEQEKTR